MLGRRLPRSYGKLGHPPAGSHSLCRSPPLPAGSGRVAGIPPSQRGASFSPAPRSVFGRREAELPDRPPGRIGRDIGLRNSRPRGGGQVAKRRSAGPLLRCGTGFPGGFGADRAIESTRQPHEGTRLDSRAGGSRNRSIDARFKAGAEALRPVRLLCGSKRFHSSRAAAPKS